MPLSRWRTWICSSRKASTTTSKRTRALRRTLEKLSDLPIVETSDAGYFYGIELVKDKETRETFDEDESERLLRGFPSKASSITVSMPGG